MDVVVSSRVSEASVWCEVYDWFFSGVSVEGDEVCLDSPWLSLPEERFVSDLGGWYRARAVAFSALQFCLDELSLLLSSRGLPSWLVELHLSEYYDLLMKKFFNPALSA